MSKLNTFELNLIYAIKRYVIHKPSKKKNLFNFNIINFIGHAERGG